MPVKNEIAPNDDLKLNTFVLLSAPMINDKTKAITEARIMRIPAM